MTTWMWVVGIAVGAVVLTVWLQRRKRRATPVHAALEFSQTVKPILLQVVETAKSYGLRSGSDRRRITEQINRVLAFLENRQAASASSLRSMKSTLASVAAMRDQRRLTETAKAFQEEEIYSWVLDEIEGYLKAAIQASKEGDVGSLTHSLTDCFNTLSAIEAFQR